MVMEGKLGHDLSPKLSTIDAKGLFKTFNAQLSGIEPLQKIGQALNVKELRNSTTLKNLITVFSVQDGAVDIEPFDFRIAGIPMSMFGRHGLDTDMNYTIRAAIPRKLIEGNIATGAALGALDQLAGQASKLGLNISPGDTLNIGIGLTGTFQRPNTSFKLLGTDGQATTVQDAVKERLVEEVNKQKDKVEARVREEAATRVDSLKSLADARARAAQDSLKRLAQIRVKEEAANKLGVKVDSTALDSLAGKLPVNVGKEADKLKAELDKFNPFKRKKKN